MATINSYLNFNGNAEEAFNMYQRVVGGEIKMIMRYKDTPEKDKVAAADLDKIMHIALTLEQGRILMATDALESMGRPLKMGNNFSLSLSAASKEEADKLYTGLSEQGESTMPMQNTFWGAYFGMLTDKFGIQWLIDCEGTPN